MTANVTNVPSEHERVVPTPAKALSFARHGYQLVFKRLLDIGAVLLALPIVGAVVLVLALIVATDRAAPFYKQRRVGRDGRIFTMWKLRTMVPNAEAKLQELLEKDEDARQEWDRAQKLRKDPRITKVGRILRKTSLDELPQLWNVLIGDMSLVGPRPMMPDQQSIYSGAGYYTVRPGITGPWQISARNDCGFRGRARFDNLYSQNVAFSGDLKILIKTVSVVARGTGH